MVTFRLAFSEDEMIAFFKKQGLIVASVTYEQHVPVCHNRVETEEVTSMCVLNPHNRETIPVSVAFEKVVYKVKNALLLDNINRMTVLEALKPITPHPPKGGALGATDLEEFEPIN